MGTNARIVIPEPELELEIKEQRADFNKLLVSLLHLQEVTEAASAAILQLMDRVHDLQDGLSALILKQKGEHMRVEQAARIAHEVNRVYCQRIGDNSQPSWEEAPDWQKQSAIKGIMMHWQTLTVGGSVPPSASHDSWLADKRASGWKYGPVKDAEKKEHPCFVPYDQLPADQQTKDYLFGAVAAATFEG